MMDGKADTVNKPGLISNLCRGLVVAIVIVLMVVLLLNREFFTVEAILNLTPGDLITAGVVFILFYAIKSISFVFPISVLQICAGLIFGPVWGIVVNILGEAVGLTLPFCLARFIFPNAKDKLFDKYPRIEEAVNRYREREFTLAFLLRTMGFIPIDVGSSAMGIMKLHFKNYFWGSLCGVLPGIIAVTCFGSAVRNPGSVVFFVSLGFSALISAVGTITFFVVVRKNKPQKST